MNLRTILEIRNRQSNIFIIRIFKRKSFGVLRCDTQIYGDQSDYFVQQVRQCFTPAFQLGLTNSTLIGIIDNELVAVILKQISRNFLVVTLHSLSQKDHVLDKLRDTIKDNIRNTSLVVCRSGLEKFMVPNNQVIFRNYLHSENQHWYYIKEIPAGLFNRTINNSIVKEM